MAVIDLTGSKLPSSFEGYVPKTKGPDSSVFDSVIEAAEQEKITPGPWLDFKIVDFDVPPWSIKVWEKLAEVVEELLDSGTDVLVSCQGGHGRTGLAVSILAYILGAVPEGEDPILWLREVHCEEVVENNKQILYIYETLGLPDNPDVQPAKKYGGATQGYNQDWNDWSTKSYKASAQPLKGKSNGKGGETVQSSLPLIRHVFTRLLSDFEKQRSVKDEH